MNQGIDNDIAEQDSVTLSFKMSPESIRKICNTVNKDEIKLRRFKKRVLEGAEFCKLWDNGSHDITFAIFKEDIKSSNGLIPSMAKIGVSQNISS